MKNPIAGMSWLNKKEVRERLSALSTGAVPLTHEGIDELSGPQARQFLRELLVDVGLLEKRDEYLASFGAWRPKRLLSISEPAARHEISLYLSWRHSRNLAVRAEAGRLSAGAVNLARDQTDAAVRFLTFLADRGHELSELSQDDLDCWFSTATNPQLVSDFLSFSMARRHFHACGYLNRSAGRHREPRSRVFAPSADALQMTSRSHSATGSPAFSCVSMHSPSRESPLCRHATCARSTARFRSASGPIRSCCPTRWPSSSRATSLVAPA